METEIGKGTTFELYFPAIDSKPVPVEKSAGGISGGKERILFVDDEDAIVNLNRQRLERLGYEVTRFTDPLLKPWSFLVPILIKSTSSLRT